jgi:hypothetical protein
MTALGRIVEGLNAHDDRVNQLDHTVNQMRLL